MVIGAMRKSKSNVTVRRSEPSHAKQLAQDDIELLRRDPPEFMGRHEACVWLGISERTLRNYEARGWIPVVRIGRRRLYRRDAVMKALEEREVGGAST